MPAIAMMEVTDRLSAAVTTATSAGCDDSCVHDATRKVADRVPLDELVMMAVEKSLLEILELAS